jgi:hypothetical protein
MYLLQVSFESSFKKKAVEVAGRAVKRFNVIGFFLKALELWH